LEEFDCRIPLDQACGQSASLQRTLTRWKATSNILAGNLLPFIC